MSKKIIVLFIFLLMGLPLVLLSQKIKTFKVSDFDLRGNVRSCLVITDYGKEEYHFDEAGRLTKSVTIYSDTDYETTYYKYKNGELIERRVENYRDDTFDSATSIANFYEVDTTSNRKVVEKIVSYDKELLERNIYSYNNAGKLIKIERTDTDGTDEHSISYDTIDGRTTVAEKINGTLLETITTSERKSEKDSLQKVVLTQKYLDGELNTKTEKIYGNGSKLLFKADVLFDVSTEKWIPKEKVDYTYDENGMLAKTKTNKRYLISTQEYIYQFDGTENNNWVKEIVTPDNTYKTRRITYYELPVVEEE